MKSRPPPPPTLRARSPTPLTLTEASVQQFPLIYLYDRTRYYRLVTVGATALLVLVWLPLTYVSLSHSEALPLWQTLIGPLTSVAIIAATHVRAKRTITALRAVDPNHLIVTTSTGLGRTHSRSLLYTDIRAVTSANDTAKSSSSNLWIVTLAGHSRYFVMDKKGEIRDGPALRRIVGDDKVFHTQQ